MANVVNGALSGLMDHSDAVFEALRALDIAREAHVAALRDLSGAITLSGEVATAAMIAWQLYRLVDLEAVEVEAAAALRDAEMAVLMAHPTTLAGSNAILAFLQSYLVEGPDIGLAIHAIGDVAETLQILGKENRSANAG